MKRLLATVALLVAAPLVAQTTARGPIVAWTYTVQAGDTFADIARRWSVDMAALGAANDIPSPYVIRIGQVLKRPDPKAAPKPLPTPSPSATPVVTPKAVPRPAPSPRPVPPLRPPLTPRESDAPKLQWPTEGAVVTHFGERVAGIPSNGIDLAALYGTKVRAAAAGTVLYAGKEPERFGQLILIDHGNGFVTAYAYLGTMTVKEGDKVIAFERIALVGKSGEARRPTVHFELRRNNVPRDPELYLPPRL
ncbi:M23 family metallopeptidase [Novosphingobium sp. ERN07]|uniref:M23 family metallopeptidase n=1 Tax=Novosphingobium sp. ERN07 TaxID=2726187 RepID=UPI00145695E5|nr:M23 family metallopeptidase [Novosphingobium sp. ERN07]NLR72705.1 M23 family metallopeptidase [Novosphingobium sp. ERN07]